jgi:sortase A
MRDKRPVDELSIEELERILIMRKREARLARAKRFGQTGRTVDVEVEHGPPASPLQAVEPPKANPTPKPPSAQAPAKRPETPTFEDELDQVGGQRAQPGGQQRSLIFSRLLTGVEVLAVIGLVGLVAMLLQSFAAVSQASANIQAQYQATFNAQQVPLTATPVINIARVVLPSGHTVRENNGVVTASFNLDEVPAQFRELYRQQVLNAAPQIRPTPLPDGPLKIVVPKLKVDSPIVYGDDWEALKLGVGHHIGSVNPGQRGNLVLSGHNDVYGEIFRDLYKLEAGDEIHVYTVQNKRYTYLVQEKRIINPTDVWVLDSQGDVRKLTLITCHPYRVDTQRAVVFATLKP